MTGTILPGGEIGKISGVIEKAQVASENNVTLFLVPLGQSEVIYYEKVLEKKKVGGLELIRIKYVPKSFDLKEYAEENLDLRVEEVSTIWEAMGYIF